MTDHEKIMHVFNRLKQIHSQRKTISYKDIGLEIDTHYRHVYKKAAYIQIAICVYNRHHGTKIPHLNALIVRSNSKYPGVGCMTGNPLSVFRFDYSPYLDEIEKILKFMLTLDINLLDQNDIEESLVDLYYKKS